MVSSLLPLVTLRLFSLVLALLTVQKLTSSSASTFCTVRLILPRVAVDAWNVKGNVLNVTMTADTLEEINLTVQKVDADELVSFCTVNNAKTNENKRTVSRGGQEETFIETSVTAQVVAYLNPDEGVDRR